MKWKPADTVIIIITLTVCTVVIAAVIIPALNQTPLSDTKAKIIGATLGSMVSIISMYVGAKIQEHKKD